MILTGGVDEITSIILNYSQLKAHAILTTSTLFKTAKTFCRIEGSKGEIMIGGEATSRPEFLIIREEGKEERRVDFGIQGWGFYWEADAVALDILAGKKESTVMPLAESLRMMQTMDSIRKANGLTYPQDT
jgi:predicted dehydrogenase